MLLGKVVTCLQKTGTRSMPITLYSINSKWIKDLNIRNTLEAIGIGKEFLSRTPAAQQLRERMDKWDYIELKSFCTMKEMVSKLKIPPTEWEKIFNGYISDK
jgi:hypothetical protein